MRIDSRILALNERYKQARVAYDEHIKQFAHPVQWPLLNEREQRDWYKGFGL